MSSQSFLDRALSTVVTGAVGVAAYNGVKAVAERAPWRESAVWLTSVSLKGFRKLEEGAESARLSVSDVVSEAKARNGEEVSPPSVSDHGHGHDH